MRVLIVDDDPSILVLLKRYVQHWGFEPITATDGVEALEILLGDESPRIALIDWMMPNVDGMEVIKTVRESEAGEGIYFIVLTARDNEEALAFSLKAGANDYISKPFNTGELSARLRVAERMIVLQREKEERIRQLEVARHKINELRDLLPVCCSCKKIRDEDSVWVPIESYVEKKSKTDLTHTYCPECYKQAMDELNQADAEK